jgi:hypothetical protein
VTIVDGEMLAGMRPSVGDAGLRELLLAFSPESEIPPPDAVDDTGPPMVAEINHGVWIASCACRSPGDPAPGCIVWLAAPLGWCVRCSNAAAGGRWRPIVLPEPDERAAIEAALAVRPSVETRNWTPGETVADLARQNAEHGVEGP